MTQSVARLDVSKMPQDGILGHQFNQRLESFAPCYSQSLLQEDFEETYPSLFLKILTKNPRYKKTRAFS
jgi:hypothetical protein